MYLRRFEITNVRSIKALEMEFEKGKEAGWHVILGPNGSGKSSVVRSFALLAMGPRESLAARQEYDKWIRADASYAEIFGSFSMDSAYDVMAGGGQPPRQLIHGTVKIKNKQEATTLHRYEADYTGERTNRTIWGTGLGWFSASFGPFRRFTGGDRIYDKLFVSNKRLAPHLSALGEDVALTEALTWFNSLWIRYLQDSKIGQTSNALVTLEAVSQFLNGSGFLPHKAKLHTVSDEHVLVQDGNGARVSIAQLSDGYRSALSLAIELVRQMFELYGHDKMLQAMEASPGKVLAPGIVAIDEVDAHLHPTWQRDIGKWLTKSFPNVQFIVTTHSPIVCRAVSSEDGQIRGTVWRLPAPGSDETFRRITGVDLDHLIYGDVLDAYGTELFGNDVTRSKTGQDLLEKLADLNRLAFERELTEAEKHDRRRLRAIFPAESGITE